MRTTISSLFKFSIMMVAVVMVATSVIQSHVAAITALVFSLIIIRILGNSLNAANAKNTALASQIETLTKTLGQQMASFLGTCMEVQRVKFSRAKTPFQTLCIVYKHEIDSLLNKTESYTKGGLASLSDTDRRNTFFTFATGIAAQSPTLSPELLVALATSHLNANLAPSKAPTSAI